MRGSPAPVVVLVVCCCAPVTTLVYARSVIGGGLRKEIRQRYEGKLLLLNTPSRFDVIHFDMKGHLTRPPNGEPWTTCGLVQTEKIDVRDNQVTIDGHRVIVALKQEQASAKPVPVTTDREVHVAIDLPPSTRDVPELNQFLSGVFSADGVAQRIANGWHAEFDVSKELAEAGKLPPGGRIGTLDGGRPVYAWESGVVTKPKAIYKPRPAYSVEARLKKVAGTIQVRVVVNENGFPEILQVVQHLPEGLDTRALSAVSQWRFERPLKDGVAAATMVLVELKFHLPPKRKQVSPAKQRAYSAGVLAPRRIAFISSGKR